VVSVRAGIPGRFFCKYDYLSYFCRKENAMSLTGRNSIKKMAVTIKNETRQFELLQGLTGIMMQR
jgi:hypothetical protein